MTKLPAFILILLIASSCVSNKKYSELLTENERLRAIAPINKAINEEEEVLLDDLKIQLSQLKQELIMANDQVSKYQMMQEAGELKEPTPEQMETYRLMNEEKIQQLEQQRMESESGGEISNLYMEAAYAIRITEAGLKEAVDGYNKDQVSITKKPGMTILSIASNELFDAGKTSLNANGKKLMTRIGVVFENQQPITYEILGVSDQLKSTNLNQASEKAMSVADYLLSSGQGIHQPKKIGVYECTAAAGDKDLGCDRVEVVLMHDYNILINQVETSLKN